MTEENKPSAVELFLMQQIKDLQAEVTRLRNAEPVLVEEPKVTPTKRYAVSTAKDRARADDKLNAEIVGPKSSSWGCFFLTLFALAGVGGVVLNPTWIPEFEEALTGERIVTLSEFNRLRTGMSYEAAVRVIGHRGDVTSESSLMGIKTVMYTWSNGIANMNAIFQNNELVTKAQFGLR